MGAQDQRKAPLPGRRGECQGSESPSPRQSDAGDAPQAPTSASPSVSGEAGAKNHRGFLCLRRPPSFSPSVPRLVGRDPAGKRQTEVSAVPSLQRGASFCITGRARAAPARPSVRHPSSPEHPTAAHGLDALGGRELVETGGEHGKRGPGTKGALCKSEPPKGTPSWGGAEHPEPAGRPPPGTISLPAPRPRLSPAFLLIFIFMLLSTKLKLNQSH